MKQDSSENTLHIYTDGSCSPNPGKGGWGAVLQFGNEEKEISGSAENTTNNRMELTAVIQALKQLKRTCRVIITTDSQYIANCFKQKWIEKWKRNGWRTASKQPVKNKDLWQELDSLIQEHDITWEWTQGHAGHPQNERADTLAVRARENN